jgi:hypothetical protein
MTNPLRRDSILALSVSLALGGVLASCGEGEDDQQAAAPAPRPAPVERVDPLEGVELDPRVEFPEQRVPESPDLARAIADMANALAQGDADAFARRLTDPAIAVLDDLQTRGEWGSATSGIETVRVVAVEAGESSARLGLGVQDPDGAYLLAWEGLARNGDWAFTGLPVESRSASRAADLDGVDLAELPIPQPGADDELTVEELRAKRRAAERDDSRDRRRDRRRR